MKRPSPAAPSAPVVRPPSRDSNSPREVASLSIVVFAYNEEGTVGEVIRELADEVRAWPGKGELIVIDDGSTDRTPAIANRFAAELPTVRVVRHPSNSGLGACYRTGFDTAVGDLVTFFPADGQFPATIVRQYEPLIASADLILGYLPARPASPLAKVLSAAERLLYRAMFGGLPKFQGILMVRRRIVSEMPLASGGRGWGIVMEVIVRAVRTGCRIVSVPTEIRPRTFGRSKVNNLRTISSNLRQVWELYRTLKGSPE